jgi:hypothetical protein
VKEYLRLKKISGSAMNAKTATLTKKRLNTHNTLDAQFEIILQQRILELERKAAESTIPEQKKNYTELLYLNTYLYKTLYMRLQ